MAACYERRLSALGYPRAKQFNPSDAEEIRAAVAWLEDTKIRALPVDKRGPLRAGGSQWTGVFEEYLLSIGCPYKYSESTDNVVEWLTAHGISMEFHDGAEDFKHVGAPNQSTGTTSSQKGSNAVKFTGIDNQEFVQTLKEIAAVLDLDPNMSTGALLRAVGINVLAAAAKVKADNNVQLEDFIIDIDTGDEVVDRAVTILRLLFTQDLRNLQNSINEIITTIQEFTANPKTDTRLGKVGK